MIIPVRCFTCNNMIGDKWEPYIKLVKKEKEKNKETVDDTMDIKYINIDDGDAVEKSIEGHVLDRLGLHKYCCRRIILGNVHLISYI